MGLRGDVGDGTDLEARGLQGADSGFTTGTRALDEQEDTDEPCLPYVESITVTGGTDGNRVFAAMNASPLNDAVDWSRVHA